MLQLWQVYSPSTALKHRYLSFHQRKSNTEMPLARQAPLQPRRLAPPNRRLLIHPHLVLWPPSSRTLLERATSFPCDIALVRVRIKDLLSKQRNWIIERRRKNKAVKLCREYFSGTAARPRSRSRYLCLYDFSLLLLVSFQFRSLS